MVSFFTLANSTAAFGNEYDVLEEAAVNSWESKVDSAVIEKMQEGDEKIPVWLWMEDIDHSVVTEKVYEATGLTEANLGVVDEDISEELAADISNLSEADVDEKELVKEEFREYLNRTEDARKAESAKVTKYLNELRTVQENMLAEKNAAIFSSLGIPEENIIISDTLAPVYIVYVESSDVQRLAENPSVMAIYYYDSEMEFVPCGTVSDDLSSVISATSIGRIRTDVGLTGKGVTVGVCDSGKVEPSTNLPASRITYIAPSEDEIAEHSTFVANIIAASNGVAPNASICSSSGKTAAEFVEAIKNMSKRDIHVMNFSMQASRDPEETNSYRPYEIYTDYLIFYYKCSIVNSAGNDGGKIGDPGLAYNIITVGGFFNQGTTDTNDDRLYKKNNYDHMGGCFKPDFVADQSSNYEDYISSDGTSVHVVYTGTSNAAPFVAGTIALLYELRPSLKAQPEAVKAILMASCHRKEFIK